MTAPSTRTILPRSARFGLLVAIVAALGTGAIVAFQARHEYGSSVDDLDRRAGLLVFRNTASAPAALALPDDEVPRAMGERLEGHGRLLGIGLLRADGRLVASAPGVADLESVYAGVATELGDGRASAQ